MITFLPLEQFYATFLLSILLLPGSATLSYAQTFEDVLPVRCFGKGSNGFYVETNAFRPMIAPSAKLFYDAGWCGISVEAGTCIDALREAEPRDNNLATAIAGRRGYTRVWKHIHEPGISTLQPVRYRERR